MQFFRVLAYVLIISGLLFFIDAARDQQRGVATATAPTRSPIPHTVRKVDSPERFEKLMLYQWARAGLSVLAGVIILGIYKRHDRMDPFASGFNDSKAIDDWGASLDAEAKRLRRPFHHWKDD